MSSMVAQCGKPAYCVQHGGRFSCGGQTSRLDEHDIHHPNMHARMHTPSQLLSLCPEHSLAATLLQSCSRPALYRDHLRASDLLLRKASIGIQACEGSMIVQPSRQKGTTAIDNQAAYAWRAACGEPAPCASRTCLARSGVVRGSNGSRAHPHAWDSVELLGEIVC